jgi:tetratricopeptide (TPR) repeat protein
VEEATISVQRALELRPGDPAASTNRALILMAQGNPAAAADLLDALLSRAPADVDLLLHRGDARVALGRPALALADLDLAVALAPKEARTHAYRATALFELQRLPEALDATDQALVLDERHLPALLMRGTVLRKMKRFEEAAVALDRILTLSPDRRDALVQKALVCQDQRLFLEAMELIDRVERLRGPDPDLLCTRANILIQQGDAIRARECLWFALALRPDHADAQLNLAMLDLLDGDFLRGWEGYEARLSSRQFRGRVPVFAVPAWDGKSPLAGRTILLVYEQGLGDTLQFVRLVPALRVRAARVLLLVQAGLADVCRALLPDLEVAEQQEALPPFDTWCPLLSLPYFLGLSIEGLAAFQPPYLSVEPVDLVRWQLWLGPRSSKPRIGVAWSGNVAHGDDHNRSLGLREFVQALPEGCEYHVLQKDVRESDLAELANRSDFVRHHQRQSDFRESAALVACMDAVVSVDTSIAHLAGALGKPLALLLPFRPDFRWMWQGTTSPWYPAARLYRQPSPGEWREPLSRLRLDLGSGDFGGWAQNS